MRRGRMAGMDEESKELLRRLAAIQAEQNALVKKYLPPLWKRVRFSLLALMLLMTLLAIGLGTTVYVIRSQSNVAASPPTTTPVPTPTYSSNAGQLFNLQGLPTFSTEPQK
jgi:hypothetical protein